MANELVVTYDASATVYAVIRRLSDQYAADVVAEAFEAWADGSIGDYDISLTSQGGDVYAADFPTWIGTGEYVISYYVQSGASPAVTDPLIGSEAGYWDGTAVTDSPAANQYVSLARTKRYLGIPAATTTYDDRINDLIPAACRLIDNWCDVDPEGFATATGTAYYNGRGNNYLPLRRFPVTSSAKVRVAQTALQILNTSSTNHQAYASVDSGVLTLTRVASGVSAASTLTLSSYATITLLAAAINAVGSGWSASVPDTNLGGYPASDLRNTQGFKDAKDDTAELEVYAPYLSGCTRTNPDTGTVWGYFPCGYQNIQVTYTAGYTTIPDDLATAAAALAAALFRRSDHDTSLKSEKIGDYSYTLGDSLAGTTVEELSPDAATLLQKYRRPRFL
jgi:hypothetical protein